MQLQELLIRKNDLKTEISLLVRPYLDEIRPNTDIEEHKKECSDFDTHVEELLNKLQEIEEVIAYTNATYVITYENKKRTILSLIKEKEKCEKYLTMLRNSNGVFGRNRIEKPINENDMQKYYDLVDFVTAEAKEAPSKAMSIRKRIRQLQVAIEKANWEVSVNFSE